MRNLIIPCAGKTLVDGRPPFLLTHPDGTMLIRKCIDGIDAVSYDRIVVTTLKEYDEDFKAAKRVLDVLGNDYPVEVLLLQQETDGPADTIYETICRLDLKGSIDIKDSDNYVKAKKVKSKNFVAGLDLNSWESDVHDLRNKSFLVLNEQGQILDIIEKQFRSDVIGLGYYGFRDVADYVFAYRRLHESGYPLESLYISHIISYLIGYSQEVFSYCQVYEYENWGHWIDWHNVQRTYATYFVDLDSLVRNGDLVDSDQWRLLRNMNQAGATIVLFTAAPKSKCSYLLGRLAALGLPMAQLVAGCSQSKIREIKTADNLLE